MTLAYDLVVAAVIAAISIVIHTIGVALFAPGTELHAIAAAAEAFSGEERAQLWYEILALYVPLGGLLLAGTYPIVRAYRRQAVTAGGTRRV